jgi:hypothetical protein
MLVRSLLVALAAMLSLALPATSAPKPPQPLTIENYFGEWQGTATAMSETDEDFPTSSRDIALKIDKSDLGGLIISWSTLQRQKGNPKGTTVRSSGSVGVDEGVHPDSCGE